MELADEFRVKADKAKVYAMLNDPEVLKICIPGCEELTETAPNQLAAKVVLKIGPVKAKFAGEVLLDPNGAPDRFSLSGEGKGGVAGFAKGGADVTLTEDGAETIVAYTANADIGGKIAQLGSRLVAGTAKRLSAQFFERFADHVEA
ncbi:MAG: carbon monoxide dehydrogenase subunit G [Pseudomonadota bacterium]